MKKLLALSLALVMALSLAACGGSNNSGSTGGTDTGSTGGTDAGEKNYNISVILKTTSYIRISRPNFSGLISRQTGGNRISFY